MRDEKNSRTGPLKNKFKLSMNYNVCVAADGRREVRVQRRVQRIMTVFGNVEHACAEVLSAVGRFEAEQL